MSRLRSVRAVIARYLELTDAVPPSPLAGQLEALRLGLTGEDDSTYWRRSVRAEAAHLERAHLAYVFGRVLSVEQRTVALLLNTPAAHRSVCSAAKGRGDCDCGALERYERLTRQADLQAHERTNADGTIERHVVSPRGERFVRPAKEEDLPTTGYVCEPCGEQFARGDDHAFAVGRCHLCKGDLRRLTDDPAYWVIVEGVTPQFPSIADVAEQLGWVVDGVPQCRRVERARAAAYAAIADSPQYMALVAKEA